MENKGNQIKQMKDSWLYRQRRYQALSVLVLQRGIDNIKTCTQQLDVVERVVQFVSYQILS